MTMSERDTRQADEPDILAELQAEVARDLAEERPPSGGPAYQVVSALVVLVLGLGAAYLSYGYGLGSLRRPGPGLWPFAVSVLIVVLAVMLLVVGRHLDDAEKFTRASLLVLAGGATFVAFGFLLPRSASRSPRSCSASSGCASSAARPGAARSSSRSPRQRRSTCCSCTA